MKKIISTTAAPAAIGPYSQAVQIGNMLHTSGQIPLNPQTMEIETDDVAAQTKQVMENIKAVLTAGEARLENVIKCTIFLADMNDFAIVNEVYGAYFTQNPPARSCVEVSRLPRDVKVEIECIAVVG
ncbi:MAG: RidA family protein [Oscillospiraceae bacterium]|nr:RidA family protein [Oscillospiraceae bacterium]